MKRFLLALTLTSVFSASAMAGSIPTCGAPDPGETSGPPAPGDQGNGGLADDGNQGSATLALLTILDLVF